MGSAFARLFFGDDFAVKSERGYWLARCRKTRSQMDGCKPGYYAHCILEGHLKAEQRQLLELRKPMTQHTHHATGE